VDVLQYAGGDFVADLDVVALGWVADVVGCSDVVVVRGLREGGSPWLLRARGRELVLRVVTDAASLVTEVAALRLAAQVGVPASRLLAHDDGHAAGVMLVLIERLPGSSQIPREPDPSRLRSLGAVAARLHAVLLEPSAELPRRDRPVEGEDFAKMRREQQAGGLLAEAEALVTQIRPAVARSVFVHGDLWHGNTLWSDGILTGLLDWDCAGVGAPGVDLGSLRCDAAICHGIQATAEILRGWEQEGGHPAEDVAYWDAVAALATPPDMGWFPAVISAQGRPDLDRATLLQRRDTFLSQALDRLR
jgi:aminoglycoside phosphotransferase (APT) family kinase protein